jgi:hypothetical protein
VASHTANDAVVAEGQRVLIGDPACFDGVSVIGVNERHDRDRSAPSPSGRCTPNDRRSQLSPGLPRDFPAVLAVAPANAGHIR